MPKAKAVSKRKKKKRCNVCRKMWKNLASGGACMTCHRKGIVPRKVSKPNRADWAMGMKYADYLKSDHWRQLKKIHCPIGTRCSVCGKRKTLQLHHVHYNLGMEQAGDVIPVCRPCHQNIHDTLDAMYSGESLSKKVQYTDAAIRRIHGCVVHVEPQETKEERIPTNRKLPAGMTLKDIRKADSKASEKRQIDGMRKRASKPSRRQPDVPLTVRSQLKITGGRRMSEFLHHRRSALTAKAKAQPNGETSTGREGR